jgi:hypothetical protein
MANSKSVSNFSSKTSFTKQHKMRIKEIKIQRFNINENKRDMDYFSILIQISFIRKI